MRTRNDRDRAAHRSLQTSSSCFPNLMKTQAFSGTKVFKPRLAVDEASLCLSVVVTCKDGKWTKRKGSDAAAWWWCRSNQTWSNQVLIIPALPLTCWIMIFLKSFYTLTLSICPFKFLLVSNYHETDTQWSCIQEGENTCQEYLGERMSAHKIVWVKEKNLCFFSLAWIIGSKSSQKGIEMAHWNKNL